MPQSLLKKLGAKWNLFTLSHRPPSMPMIRNVLTGRRPGRNGYGEWEFAPDGKVMRRA
jgi:hypothetical protein